jgi:hypothetical protein
MENEKNQERVRFLDKKNSADNGTNHKKHDNGRKNTTTNNKTTHQSKMAIANNMNETRTNKNEQKPAAGALTCHCRLCRQQQFSICVDL